MGEAADLLTQSLEDWPGKTRERNEILYYSGRYCLNCGCDTELVYGDKIYPHRSDLFHKTFYICPECKAYVGCHQDGRAFGTIAGPALRKARSRAHAAFDPLWENKNFFSNRRKAYQWLAKKMRLPTQLTHIGMFDIPECLLVETFCKQLKGEENNDKQDR